MKRTLLPCLALSLLVQTGCRQPRQVVAPAPPNADDPKITEEASGVPECSACQLILASRPGDSPLDKQIAQAQETVRLGRVPAAALERLGWLFVTKARTGLDDGFYKLAEQCAACLDSLRPGNAAALLLRGHVLHNLHRFKEAEPIARRLTTTRGAPFDYGLLGDVLMEQGQLAEAAVAYQNMMDLRPDSRALSRAAHLRWLRGDLPGAVEAMQEAARAVGSRDADSAAWMHARLGYYHLASGDAPLAGQACAVALQLQTNYAPALFMQGRVHLAAGECDEAVEPLQRAVRINPLPEYQWALAEALFESGRFDEARAMEAELLSHGAQGDSRTFALYLATRREQLDLALALARHELQQRADVFTHDTLAWCLARAGRLDEARVHMDKALTEGTVDGRLFFHAAVIAAKSGRADEAGRWRTRAEGAVHLLLPSERRQLRNAVSSPELKQSGAVSQSSIRTPQVVSASGQLHRRQVESIQSQTKTTGAKRK